MNTKDFYYYLPEELIAQTPLENRSDSRLMLLDRKTGSVSHSRFFELKKFLKKGDRIVLNNTRVIPARLLGVRARDMRPVELLLLRRLSEQQLAELGLEEEKGGASVIYEALAGPGKRAKEGDVLSFGNDKLKARIIRVKEDGNRIAAFDFEGIFEEILEELGKMPLPPYIHEELKDASRYQTVYAKYDGSAAAPTAGLHFTEKIFEELREIGVDISFVTLHVGLGTFRPVKEERIENHLMHKEWYSVSEETAAEINETKKRGGRIIAVGTTSCRTLESAADENGMIQPGARETGIFIYPGYTFRAIDGLITNFHLPESTLIMLVSAFAGRENVLNAYKIAVDERYRFFSFGDAMFIR